MSSTPKYSPSSGFLPSVASATLLTRNSALRNGGMGLIGALTLDGIDGGASLDR